MQGGKTGAETAQWPHPSIGQLTGKDQANDAHSVDFGAHRRFPVRQAARACKR